MSNNANTDLTLSQKSQLEELAAELSINVEALEERLEMVSLLDAATCCVINGGACHVSAA
jgi:hypothetical protein